jgi:hypothetical protein
VVTERSIKRCCTDEPKGADIVEGIFEARIASGHDRSRRGQGISGTLACLGNIGIHRRVSKIRRIGDA